MANTLEQAGHQESLASAPAMPATPDSITVRRMVSLQDAIQIAINAGASEYVHQDAKRIEKTVRQALAVQLLLQDIGIEGHDYGNKVRAVLRQDHNGKQS